MGAGADRGGLEAASIDCLAGSVRLYLSWTLPSVDRDAGYEDHELP